MLTRRKDKFLLFTAILIDSVIILGLISYTCYLKFHLNASVSQYVKDKDDLKLSRGKDEAKNSNLTKPEPCTCQKNENCPQDFISQTTDINLVTSIRTKMET